MPGKSLEAHKPEIIYVQHLCFSLGYVPFGKHHVLSWYIRFLGTKNDLPLTTDNQRSALSSYALSKVHTIVLLLMWLPPHSHYHLLLLFLAYPPLPIISTPLFSFQFLPLSFKFKLIVQMSPATAYNIPLPGAPEPVCKSATHWLYIERSWHCGCHSCYRTVIPL